MKKLKMFNKVVFPPNIEAIFIANVSRVEYLENPRVYVKGIRAALITLGFNQEYIEGEFRDRLEKYLHEHN